MNLAEMSKDDLRDIAVECQRDTKLFAKVFFPDHFYIPFSPKLHDKMFDVIDHCDAPKIVIKAPRGVGKSTIFSLVWPTKKLLYRESNFMVLGSGSIPLARQHSENIKSELLNNRVIRLFQNAGLFPGMKPVGKADDFSKEQWVTQMVKSPLPDLSGTFDHSTMVLPVSWKQKVRGRRYGIYRPDFVLIDDLEDPEEVRSESQTRYIKEWFNADLKNLVQRSETRGKGEFPWQMIVIGTLLGDNTLMAELCESKDWEVVELELCNDKLESNWPQFMSDEAVRKDYQEHKDNDTIHLFYLEYRGMALPPEKQKFKDTYFKYYKDVDIKDKVLQPVVLLDPAKTQEEYSSDTAIVGWGFDAFENRLYLLDVVYGKLHPGETMEELFDMAQRLSNGAFKAKIGYEKTGLNDYISWPIENYNNEHGYDFELIDLSATGDKDDRIFSLAPLYRRGQILHPADRPGVYQPLELQLLRMPVSKRKDVADAASYIVQMLRKGSRYFFLHPKAKKKAFEDRMRSIRSTIYRRMGKPRRQRLYV